MSTATTASAGAPKTPVGGSRHWIAWKTKVLNDADVMLMPNIARMAFPYLLALSADQGLEGRVPVSPRACQVSVRCDGGVPEMADALRHLMIAGLLVVDPDDDAFLYFRGWDSNQADRGGSVTRPKTSTASQNVRRHNEGKHSGVAREGCELCLPPSAVQVENCSHNEVATPAARQSDARGVKARAWDRCTAEIEQAKQDGRELVEVYSGLYEWMQEQAPRYASVKGIGTATLLNVVVSHCAHTFLSAEGTGPDAGTLNVLHGLRRDHGADVLGAIALGAKANHPVPYIQGIFRDAK